MDREMILGRRTNLSSRPNRYKGLTELERCVEFWSKEQGQWSDESE